MNEGHKQAPPVSIERDNSEVSFLEMGTGHIGTLRNISEQLVEKYSRDVSNEKFRVPIGELVEEGMKTEAAFLSLLDLVQHELAQISIYSAVFHLNQAKKKNEQVIEAIQRLHQDLSRSVPRQRIIGEILNLINAKGIPKQYSASQDVQEQLNQIVYDNNKISSAIKEAEGLLHQNPENPN